MQKKVGEKMNKTQNNERKLKAIIIPYDECVVVSIPPFFKPVIINLIEELKKYSFNCLKNEGIKVEIGDRDYYDITLKRHNKNMPDSLKKDLEHINEKVHKYFLNHNVIQAQKFYEQEDCLSLMLSPIYTGLHGINSLMSMFLSDENKPKLKKP